MSKEEMKLALEALTFSESDSMAVEELIDDAIVALEEALAKQEGQSNFCPNCEDLSRELKAIKQEQVEPVAKKVAECLAVLRPSLAGKFPHEQALEELISYTHQQLKVDKHTDDLCRVLIEKTHIQERQIAELQSQLVAQPKQEQGEPKCNPHPKAPHGFNRNASHSEDRYVCECEGWDAYEAGKMEGVRLTMDEWGKSEPPQQRKPLWIDTNDKTQAKFLPNIGEPVLFCHEGKTYYGRHTGGSFQYGAGVTKRDFNTWECRWMYLPAAHGIKE